MGHDPSSAKTSRGCPKRRSQLEMARIMGGGIDRGLDRCRNLRPRAPIIIGIYHDLAGIIGTTVSLPPHLHGAVRIVRIKAPRQPTSPAFVC